MFERVHSNVTKYLTRASRSNTGTEIKFVVRNGQLQEWVEGKCELQEVKTLQIRDDGTIYDGHELIPLRAGDVSRVMDWLIRVRSRTSCRVDHYESVRVVFESVSHSYLIITPLIPTQQHRYERRREMPPR